MKNGLKKNIQLYSRLGLAQKDHSLKIKWIFINLEWIRGGGDLEAVDWGNCMGGISSRRGGLVLCWTVAAEEERCALADYNPFRASSLSVKWQKPAGNHGYGIFICNMISGMESWILLSLYMEDFRNVWINGFVSWKFEFVILQALKFFDSFPWNTWYGLFKGPFSYLGYASSPRKTW